MLADTTTIAQAVRTEVRAAVRVGTIELPQGSRVSVRSRHGDCVEITIVNVPDRWTLAENEYGNQVLSPAARALGDQLVELLRRHLDWQWGRVMTDYGHSLGSVARRGWAPGQD